MKAGLVSYMSTCTLWVRMASWRAHGLTRYVIDRISTSRCRAGVACSLNPMISAPSAAGLHFSAFHYITILCMCISILHFSTYNTCTCTCTCIICTCTRYMSMYIHIRFTMSRVVQFTQTCHHINSPHPRFLDIL